MALVYALSHATPPLLAWRLLHYVLLLCSDSRFTVVLRYISATQSVELCVGAAESINHRGHQVLDVKDTGLLAYIKRP